jgi:hypothetical protein
MGVVDLDKDCGLLEYVVETLTFVSFLPAIILTVQFPTLSSQEHGFRLRTHCRLIGRLRKYRITHISCGKSAQHVDRGRKAAI